MARVPPRSTAQIEALLAHYGFHLSRSHGAHNVWKHGATGVSLPVPRNRSQGKIPVGTVTSILRKAGIRRDEALAFWGIE